MANFYDVIQDRYGNGVSGAIVRFYETGTDNLKYEVTADNVGRIVVNDIDDSVNYDIKVYSSDGATLLYEQTNRAVGDRGLVKSDFYINPNLGYYFELFKLVNRQDPLSPPGNYYTAYIGWWVKYQFKFDRAKLEESGLWGLGQFLKIKWVNNWSWSNLRYDDTYNADNIDISVDLGENAFGDFYCLDTATNEIVVHLTAWGFNRDAVLWGNDYYFIKTDYDNHPPHDNISDGDIIGTEMSADYLLQVSLSRDTGDRLRDFTKGIEKNVTQLFISASSSIDVRISHRNSVIGYRLYSVTNNTRTVDDLYNVSGGQVNNTITEWEIVPIEMDNDLEVHYWMNDYGGLLINIHNNSAGTKSIILEMIG